MISNFLFYEDDVSLQEKYNYVQLKLEIRELLKNDFNRRVLVEILLDLQRDIAGDARNRLFKLYKDLGLHLDAFEKLKSRRWEVISKGILELTHLQVEESYGFIKKFINHRRGVIRKQAQMATVSLKHEGIIYFLDTCKYRISEWQQLKLLDVIRNLEDFQPPRFKAWLTAKNKDVVLFSLRLIKYYKQNDANSSLIELVKHKNDQIKIEAINCIKDFAVFEALNTLKAVFWKCSSIVKLSLLDAVASLGKEADIPFLKMVEKKEKNFMVKSKALSAINIISPGTVMPTHGIESIVAYNTEEEEIEAEDDAIDGKAEGRTDSDAAFEENIPIPGTSEQQINEETTVAQHKTNSADFDEIDLEVELEENEAVQLENKDEELPGVSTGSAIPEEEVRTTEDLQEININDPEEIIMEPKEEFQKEVTPLSNESGVSSEEAYWEAVLDPEEEDEIIFDLCLMEELDDILSQAVKPEGSYAAHEILPLDFLPIVEDEDIAQHHKSTGNQDPILDIEVFEEVVDEDEKFAQELDRILQKVKASAELEEEEIILDFIPVVVDTEEEERPAIEHDSQDISLDELIVYYEEEKGHNATEDEQRSKPEELSIVMPWETSDIPDSLSPLQEDIEEPGLLLEQELYRENTEEEALFELNTELDERVSIFNELFRTCDAESKLILLDEILAVGDERDLRFLGTLATDEDTRVRKKAKKIGEKLKDYLTANSEEAQESVLKEGLYDEVGNNSDAEEESRELKPLEYCFFDENKSRSTQPLGLFEIDFELNDLHEGQGSSIVTIEGGGLISQNAQHGLLDEILAIPTKLIQKLNG